MTTQNLSAPMLSLLAVMNGSKAKGVVSGYAYPTADALVRRGLATREDRGAGVTRWTLTDKGLEAASRRSVGA